VAPFDDVRAEHVNAAIEEYDALGGDAFLRRYGFGRSREYLLWQQGQCYDSKAILGVALRHAEGRLATWSHSNGGVTGAAQVLTELGFTVFPISAGALQAEHPGDGEWREASVVGSEEAHAAWASSAYEALREVATRYHGLVTSKELAGLVQMSTGIRTRQLTHYWIGEVLVRVSRECARQDEPLLSSLCVNATGSVGDGYAVAVRELRGEDEIVGDPDDHAARERLDCYRHFGATIPDGGGRPALVPKYAEARSRLRKTSAQTKQADVCPTCNMAIPPTGVCDNCG
jgi:hypothetical protein